MAEFVYKALDARKQFVTRAIAGAVVERGRRAVDRAWLYAAFHGPRRAELERLETVHSAADGFQAGDHHSAAGSGAAVALRACRSTTV